MRRIIKVCLFLGTLWCLWWFGASAVLHASLETWLETRRSEGWQAEASAVSGGGFPLTLVANLENPRFADPGTGVAIAADSLRFEADAWWPGQARLLLPQTPIRLAAPDGRTEMTMQDGRLRLDLAPNTQLGLRQLSWLAGPWDISSPEGRRFSADNLTLSMMQGGDAERYLFDINMDAARPGEVPRARLRIPEDWPLTFSSLQIKMDVLFDRPWDRRALEDRRPQPRHINLQLAEAAWGDLRLKLAADLQVSPAGEPTGEIRLQARNWQAMIDLAQGADLLPQNLRPQVTSIFQTLAGATGNPETIDVTLQAQRGLLFFGFLPVGPAPILQLR